MYCDTHFHIVQSASYYENIQNSLLLFSQESTTYYACSCSHDKNEYIEQCRLISQINTSPNVRIENALGIHPQNPVIEMIPFLEDALEKGELDAVGESGFDFFTPEFKQTANCQETVWAAQVELAALYKKPLIVHCRKAVPLLFRDSKKLKKIPSVIFHSFPGSYVEAVSLLRRGIPAYFSFGKPVLNGNKKAIDCTARLPLQHLLFETDAPFQTLYGEKYTPFRDITSVYKKAYELRNNTAVSEENFIQKIKNNFTTIFSALS